MVSRQRKAIAILQARMGSTRLPGKVLRLILGKPMLQHIIERLKRARLVDSIVIATTTSKVDRPVLKLAGDMGVASYAGSEEDVLDRYYQAATQFNAEVIVRICGDGPLLDAEVIDKVIREYFSSGGDYTSNTVKKTFPLGLDTEVFSYQALERAHKEAKKSDEREHVTPYIRRHPEIFRIRNVANDIDYSSLRWTVDTIEDLTFARKIYSHFQSNTFTWREVLRLLEIRPEWLEINRHIQQKVVL